MDTSKYPNKIYPSCWNDDERMTVLFAPFRVREVNPENYDSKMKFWQDMIVLYCVQTGTVIFSKLAVQTAFARGSNIAYGLDTVIDQLLRLKKIRLRTEYEYDPQNGWTSWAINGLVWRPLSWSVLQLKNAVGYGDEKSTSGNIEYVHLEAIETFCKDLQTKILQQHPGEVMHYAELKKLVEKAEIQINSDSLESCLRTLQCRRLIVLEYKKEPKGLEIHLVKVPVPNDKNNASITETEHAIHNLQMTQSNLLKQIEDLEAQIASTTEKVRQCVKENKRQMAKSHLRKKHLLEKSYAKRSAALQNIEELLNSVTEARSHGEILDAYKIGSRALQNVLNTSGLSYDNVDEVIADIRETLDTHREVEDAMANTSLADTNISSIENDELERELKDLVEDNKTNSNELNKNKKASPPTTTTKTPSLEVNINDKELLAMLDALEVEDKSLDETKKLTV